MDPQRDGSSSSIVIGAGAPAPFTLGRGECRTRSLADVPYEDAFGYSQGVAQDGLVAISGQVGAVDDATAADSAGSLRTRCAEASADVLAIACELAGPRACVVSTRIRVVGRLAAAWDDLAVVHRSAFGADAPALSVVPVTGLSRPDYLVEVSAMATAEAVSLVPDDSPIGTAFGCSRAVRAGGLVFVSGHVALDEHGQVCGATPAAQLEIIFDDLVTTLGQAGSELSEVLSLELSLAVTPTSRMLDEVAGVNRRRFLLSKPATTLAFVQELPLGALIQVSAVAMVR